MPTTQVGLLLLIGSFLLALPGVTSECSWMDDTCEFWLEVKHKMTMMHGKKAVYSEKGKLYQYDVTNTSAATPIDPDEVVVADGWETQRLVAAVNGSMPGPPIIVYEGQKVIVNVKNMMTSAALTIHWHGLHQKGTPWMDGVAYVTQCPIIPYGSYKYEFDAYPSGTFWYHSHIGSELSQGVIGAFIVRKREAPRVPEHIMMLMDWNHDFDADLVHMKMVYGSFKNRKKVPTTDSLDGSHFSNFLFQSGLINGRGRYYDENGITTTESPLTVFSVEQGTTYRFRIIGSGSLYPFRVSIDGHKMRVVETDGFGLEPVEVESLVINPGERYDVMVEADQDVGNYWVRSESLEIDVFRHLGEAILRYEGAPEEEPTTDSKACSQTDRCLVLNCPYSYYPTEAYTDCTHLGEMKSLARNHTVGLEEDDVIEDIFFNFAFPGIDSFPGSINGRAFVKPPVNMLTQPHEMSKLCKDADCGDEKHCHCANSVELENNKVYQFVFLNMGNGKGWAHPIHMHGHSFQVVKMAYPKYNSTTGKTIEDNLDIDCGGHPNRDKSFCNSAKWANTSWGGNNVPGLNLESPLWKDTIIVPSGGYAVVRIRANNPGLWFMHCHIELHNLDGMAVMLNESFGLHPTPPLGVQTCGDFVAGEVHTSVFTKRIQNKAIVTQVDTDDDDDFSKTEFWVAVGILGGVIVILVLIIIGLLLLRHTSSKDITKDKPETQYHNQGFS